MKIQLSSLRYKIFLTVLGISVPAILLFFAINTYAIKKIQQQIYNNNLNLMNVHISELETELASASNKLLKQSIDNSSINNFASSDSKMKYNAVITYHRENADALKDFKMLEGQIAFSPQNNNMIIYFNDYDSDYKKREAVLKYVKEHAKELAALNGRWKTCRIDDEWILLGASGNEKAVYCFWTTYNLMMRPVKNWKLPGDSYFCFVSQDGKLYSDVKNEELSTLSYDGDLSSYYFGGDRNKYLISGVETSIGNFRLMNVVERKACLGIFPQMQILGILVLIFVLFAGIPCIIHILNKSVFNPVDRMESGIREVEGGNLTAQIENLKSSREMEHLIQSFNEMILQVRDMKIQTYEESLERQKLELDYLNLQIEPHFYLNALNVINVTAQVGDTKLIYQMTKNLSQYMRYLMGSRKELVTLQEEIEHVGHYLNIMEIRLGENFSYKEQIEENLLTLKIPPLMIQTLVENSVKYAFDVYKESIIEVHVERKGTCCHICVMDNGDGYPKEYLERFNNNFEPEGNHIGIMNLRSRLHMIFGEKASIRIFNREPQGACTEIIISADNVQSCRSDRDV
jgi:two-component system sensor histidine kinase YesM